MFTVIFKKIFTKGALKGIEIVDSLDCVNFESAENWVVGILENQKSGSLNWEFGFDSHDEKAVAIYDRTKLLKSRAFKNFQLSYS